MSLDKNILRDNLQVTFDSIATQLKTPIDILFADPEIGSRISGVLFLGFRNQERIADRIPEKTYLELALVFKPGLSHSESMELISKVGDLLLTVSDPALADMLYFNHIFCGFTSIDKLGESQFVQMGKGQKIGIFAPNGDFEEIKKTYQNILSKI